jgi:MFS family permease
MPFQWVTKDAWLIMAARGLRNFALGSIAIFMVIYLKELGFSLFQVGAFLSAGVAGSGIQTFMVGLVSDRLGRRWILVGSTLLAGFAGLSLMFFNDFLMLAIFAVLGGFAASGGPQSGGAAQPVEQASLADIAPQGKRTDLFALYRIIGTGATAFGALSAGLPVLFREGLSISEIDSFKIMFGGYAVLVAMSAILYSRLSANVEVDATQRSWTNPLTLPSRRLIFTLVGLFGVDQFGGALLVQSLIAYWFNTKFGLDLGSLALVFFASQALSATSLWVAAKLANRIGLINTMVFTHIPSSLFLIGAIFSPYVWLAIGLWQLRAFFGQMDVPTRDSYTMSIVGPEERVVMASMMGAGRSIFGVAGPSLATLLWTVVAASAPFVAGAALKISYDLMLFYMFRKVKPPEEVAKDLGGKGKETVPPAG